MRKLLAGGLVSLFCLTFLFSPVSAVSTYSTGEPTSVQWPTGPVLDQGDTSECVGYSLATLMADGPLAFSPDKVPSPGWIYFGAQARDFESNTPHEGSTIEAGFQYLEDYGYVDSVQYTNDANQVADWVLKNGPVEMATEWDWLMGNPDASGVITSGGLIASYHAYVLDGYNSTTQMFDGQTSNGTKFANGGHFFISKESVEHLLTNEGSLIKEAALAQKDVTRWFTSQF